ncbi:MAG: nucleoside deaminase [Marinicaulis sp.]|nr:nucleoside deaminase [Marinicaulis sp.]NNL87699.1 nucleoside deaminase [Marinicaulis sp.]
MDGFDIRFVEIAFEEARKSLLAGGLPIGAALVNDGALVSRGHNQRIQNGDPIAHGEMDCLRRAGRQKSYKSMTLYTSLSPCMMCAGTIVQFKIPRIVISDTENFGGNEAFLREHGVAVADAAHQPSITQMQAFIKKNPTLWHEDIME